MYVSLTSSLLKIALKGSGYNVMKLTQFRSIRARSILLVVLVLTSISFASAEAVNPVASDKSEAATAQPWPQTWRGQAESVDKAGYSMVIGLGLCITVLFGGLALAKKAGWVKAPARNRSVQVLEKVALSPKSSLCVIEAEGKKYLIAVGSERVSLVSRLGQESIAVGDDSFEEYLCEKAQPLSAC